MSIDPYKPPQATVEDLEKKRPSKWGRSIWLHLPLTGFLALIFFDIWLEEPAAFDVRSIGIGGMLSLLLLIHPVRKLVQLNESPSPWHYDVIYYLTVLVALGGLVIGSNWIFVAAFLPTLLVNGGLGVGALIIERTRRIRVYTAARCWVFEPVS